MAGNAQSAVDEATRQVQKPQGIIFMTDYNLLPQVAEILQQKYPDAEVIGTSGTSYCNKDCSDKMTVITAIESEAKISAGRISRLDSCPVEDLVVLERSLKDVGPGKEDTVVIEFCTNEEERLVTTMRMALEKNDIGLCGGTVFGAPNGKPSYVAINGELFENSCVYMVIKNTAGKARVYAENIYGKYNEVPHIATRVNRAKKALVELDHRPAADVYAETLGISRNEVVGNVLKNPMGRSVGDQLFVASAHTLEPNGTLLNYKKLNENDTIYVLQLLDYDDINRQTREAIQSSSRKIDLMFSFNCIYRYMLFTQENYFGTLLQNMATLGPHVGYVAGGEQYSNQHVNQTMVCAVFE